MGIVSASILHDGSEVFRGSVDFDEFEVRYHVVADTVYDSAVDMIQDAIFLRFLPGPGTLYRDNLTYTCRSLDGQPAGDGACFHWFATATFSNEPIEVDTSDDPERFDPEYPERDLPTITLRSEKYSRPMLADWSGNPCINSAGDQMNSLPEMVFKNRVIEYQWKSRDFLDLVPLVGTLNAFPVDVFGYTDPYPPTIKPGDLESDLPRYAGFIEDAVTSGPFVRRFQNSIDQGGNGLPQEIEYYEHSLTLSITDGAFTPAGTGYLIYDPLDVMKYKNLAFPLPGIGLPHPNGHRLVANVGYYQMVDHRGEGQEGWDPNASYNVGDIVKQNYKIWEAIKESGPQVPEGSVRPGSDNRFWIVKYGVIEKKRIRYKDIDDSLRGGDFDIGDDPVDVPQWLDESGALVEDQGPPIWNFNINPNVPEIDPNSPLKMCFLMFTANQTDWAGLNPYASPEQGFWPFAQPKQPVQP